MEILIFIIGFLDQIIFLWPEDNKIIKDMIQEIEKDLLTKELGFKKKELTLHVMSLMKRNEMLSQVYKNIVVIEKEAASDEIRHALKKVLKELHPS